MSCCNGCPRRTATCHATCRDYAIEFAEHQKVYDARKETSSINHAILSGMDRRTKERRKLRKWKMGR